MDTAALRACYARLEAMGVDVFTCPMQNHKALCSPDGALALNPAAIESGAEEQAILLHEEGHFATGAFYTVQSPYTIRQKQENIANRYIYKRYFPPQRLQAAMAAGLREPWQLAEYFDLPEAMTQKEVADRLGISQSYISRLEKRIIAKMRRDIVSQI